MAPSLPPDGRRTARAHADRSDAWFRGPTVYRDRRWPSRGRSPARLAPRRSWLRSSPRPRPSWRARRAATVTRSSCSPVSAAATARPGRSAGSSPGSATAPSGGGWGRTRDRAATRPPARRTGHDDRPRARPARQHRRLEPRRGLRLSLAARSPHRVRQVITLGSPLRMAPNVPGGDPGDLGVQPVRRHRLVAGVDAPREGRQRENVEVPGSHLGLGHNTRVLNGGCRSAGAADRPVAAVPGAARRRGALPRPDGTDDVTCSDGR